jgi:hypothetical protein
MSASSNWHYRSVVAGAEHCSVSGMCGHSRDQVIMNIHTVRLGLFTLQ